MAPAQGWHANLWSVPYCFFFKFDNTTSSTLEISSNQVRNKKMDKQGGNMTCSKTWNKNCRARERAEAGHLTPSPVLCRGGNNSRVKGGVRVGSGSSKHQIISINTSLIYIKVFLIVDEVHCTLPHQDTHTLTSSPTEQITSAKSLLCRGRGNWGARSAGHSGEKGPARERRRSRCKAYTLQLTVPRIWTVIVPSLFPLCQVYFPCVNAHECPIHKNCLIPILKGRSETQNWLAQDCTMCEQYLNPSLGLSIPGLREIFFVPRNQEDALSHILSTSQVYNKHCKRKMEEKRLDAQVKRGSTLDSFLQRHNSHWSPLVTSQHPRSL